MIFFIILRYDRNPTLSNTFLSTCNTTLPKDFKPTVATINKENLTSKEKKVPLNIIAGMLLTNVYSNHRNFNGISAEINNLRPPSLRPSNVIQTVRPQIPFETIFNSNLVQLLADQIEIQVSTDKTLISVANNSKEYT